MYSNEISELLNKKRAIEKELSSLLFGAIEIRENNTKKYIYIHTRYSGKLLTQYVGEYSETLHNLILKNNKKAKVLKAELKNIASQLEKINYMPRELSEKVKSNIDLARRNIVHTIYEQAILEGVATTFIDTETIIEGGRVKNMSVTDVSKIINLKHAWDFVLDEPTIMSDQNFALLSRINKLVEEGFYYNAGKIRDVPVRIGGSSWKPELPLESQIAEDLANILSRKDSHIDIAIALLLYISKKQIFLDGNKRTALIFANHYLISKGAGLLVIPTDFVQEYKKLLIDFCEGAPKKELHDFLLKNCYIKIG